MNTWPGWKNVKLLGKGSYGSVYKIEKEEFGRIYKSALKVISIPFNDAEYKSAESLGLEGESLKNYFYSSVKAVMEECSLMHELKGITNIVSYEGHMVMEKESGFGWDILIRMELLTPLETYIKQHKFTKKDICQLGIDICNALEVCEKNRILHRDIKPANIFVSRLGDFKLGDFGIARTMEKTSGNLSQKGTYNYMAPEVYKGENYNHTVDIYSLGIVLYRLLNKNRLPFLPEGALTMEDMNTAQANRMRGFKIPFPKNAEDSLGKVVLKSIEYEPNDRYQSASEFRMALEKCMMEDESTIVHSQEVKMEPPVFNTEEPTVKKVITPPVKENKKINPKLILIPILCLALIIAGFGISKLFGSKSTKYDFPSTVLFDENNVEITFNEFIYDDQEEMIYDSNNNPIKHHFVKVHADNKTYKDIYLDLSIYINGYKIESYPFGSESLISANGDSDVNYMFYDSELQDANIEKINELEIHVTPKYTDSSEKNNFTPVTKTLTLDDSYTQPTDDSGEIIYNQNSVKVVYKGVEDSPKNDYQFGRALFYIENNSSKDLNIDFSNYCVNEYNISYSPYISLLSGKKAVVSVNFQNSELPFNSVENIKTMEFKINANECLTYDQYLKTDTILINVNENASDYEKKEVERTEYNGISIDPTVIYDKNNIKITVNNIYGYNDLVYINCTFENQNETTVNVNGDMYLNDCQVTMLYQSINSKKTFNYKFTVMNEDLEKLHIEKFKTIGFDLKLSDESYQNIDTFYEEVNTTATKYEEPRLKENNFVYEYNDLKLYTSIGTTFYTDTELRFFAKNNSDIDYTVSIKVLKINGKISEDNSDYLVVPKKKSAFNMMYMKNPKNANISENKDIKEIILSIEIKDKQNYSTITTDTITITAEQLN